MTYIGFNIFCQLNQMYYHCHVELTAIFGTNKSYIQILKEIYILKYVMTELKETCCIATIQIDY